MYWDRAWSLVEGCSRYSPGCNRCWSAAQTHIRSHQGNPKIVARYGGLTDQFGRFNGTVRFMPDSLALPLRTRKPTTWSLWNDLFHEKVTDEQIAAAFGVMAATPQHRYLVLTKRADRLPRWFEWADEDSDEESLWDRILGNAVDHLPQSEHERWHDLLSDAPNGFHVVDRWPLGNVALGVTVEHHRFLDRVDHLRATPAGLRFLSLEPLLSFIPVDLTGIGWVVVGPETGLGRRPCHDDHIRQALKNCKAAHVPVWVKAVDLGKRVSHDPSEWPEDLRLRQLPAEWGARKAA
jgi:protein gp37